MEDKFDIKLLSDIDLEIKIRSGKTESRELAKFINAIMASLITGLVPTLVLTETYQTNRINGEGNLVTISYRFYKE